MQDISLCAAFPRCCHLSSFVATFCASAPWRRAKSCNLKQLYSPVGDQMKAKMYCTYVILMFSTGTTVSTNTTLQFVCLQLIAATVFTVCTLYSILYNVYTVYSKAGKFSTVVELCVCKCMPTKGRLSFLQTVYFVYVYVHFLVCIFYKL